MTTSSYRSDAAVDDRVPGYRHVQAVQGLWFVLPASLGGTALGLRLAMPHESGLVPAVILLAVGLGSLLVFGRLVIEVVGAGSAAELRWRFGWLPWPRWRLPLAEVAAAESARSTWLEGWGIRSTREGALYNASGFAAVRLRLKNGKSIRLGTPEPERLRAFVQARLANGADGR
jgi:hypothetical protein